jgi:hypothetical protein
MVKSVTPKGAATYPTLYPWMYLVRSVADGEDPENYQKLFKKVFEWFKGDENNDYSAGAPEKKVHSQARNVYAPTDDLKAPPPPNPEPRTQPEIMGELKKKLAELLPGGEEDAKVHFSTLRSSLGIDHGGILKKGVFVDLVKGMEALIEQYSQKGEEETKNE